MHDTNRFVPLPSSECGGPAAEPAASTKCPCSIFQHSSQETEVLSKSAANKNTATFWRQRMHLRAAKRRGTTRQATQVSRQLFSRWKDKTEELPIKSKWIFGKVMWNLQKENTKKQTNTVSSITPEQGRRAEPSSGDPSCQSRSTVRPFPK